MKKLLSYLKLTLSNLFNYNFLHKFGTKNALFGCFWTGIRKQYYHISNQHLQICLIPKFHKIMKMPKINIWAQKCLIWGFFGWNLKDTILSCWKSAPSNLSNCKISRKSKILKFGSKNALNKNDLSLMVFLTKNVLLGIFGLKFEKKYYHI